MIEVREVRKREEKGKCPKDECCGATNVLARMPSANASRMSAKKVIKVKRR